MQYITLFILGLISVAFSDDKYRTYGQFSGSSIPESRGGCPTNSEIDKIPFRPANLYLPKGDYISVGTVDGNTYSPLSSYDHSEIAVRFSTLVEKTSEIPGGPTWLNAYKMLAGAVDPPIPSNEQSKEQILNQLMVNECGTVNPNGHCQNYIDLVNQYLGSYVNATEVVFEIGNEPNVFPYMSAKLYAWFYWHVREKIKAVEAEFSGTHPFLKFKFMPAGLWIMEGLPQDIRDRVLFSDQHQRMSLVVTGHEANGPGGFHFPHQSTLDYYNEFLTELMVINLQQDPSSTLKYPLIYVT